MVEERDPARMLWFGDCEFMGNLLACVAIMDYDRRLVLDVTVDYGSSYEEMKTWTVQGITPARYQASLDKWYNPASVFRDIARISKLDIVLTLQRAGILPNDYWLEWSNNRCDRRVIMGVLGILGD